MARRDKEPLPMYQCRPPNWLPKTHSSADLGYVGFFPPRPDQEEEILTEANVKNGISQGYSVPIETYSAQEAVNSRLGTEDTLSELEDLMDQIFARKAANVPDIPPPSFKLPSRVTLNDVKRKQWFADLANPEVPLSKLGKSVPHGAKGHDLLELLQSHNVETGRAIWFLRVFGANETAGLRNKPTYNPTHYSVEWANVVTGYVRKLLMEIALPIAPRPGLNMKFTFKSVLADPGSRKRWLDRFKYCLDLLRPFYSEGLVDNRTFLAWLVQQMRICDLAQLGFVARLAEEYLDGMLVCRSLTHPFAEACLLRYSEIVTSYARDHLTNTTTLLKTLILRTFLACPDAFVSPKMWLQHEVILQDLLSERLQVESDHTQGEPSSQNLHQKFITCFEDVARRNEAMLLRDLPPRARGSLSATLTDIKLLNSFTSSSDVNSMHFFDEASDDAGAFARKVELLLTWSVTPLQFGDHRPYVAASLLHLWLNLAEERAVRRQRDYPDEIIQDLLFDWLDSSEVTADSGNLPSIAFLYGQLVKRGLFSYSRYIQRLIARGELGLSASEVPPSRHREFLRWIPLHSSSKSLITQRKVTLYGIRARETPEDVNERTIRKDMRSLIPELFSGQWSDVEAPAQHDAQTLLSATRFEQIRIFNDWLVPIFKKALSIPGLQSPLESNNDLLRPFCIIADLMARCKCYGSIYELCIHMLGQPMSSELLSAVMQTLRQHAEVWSGLDVMKEIVSALFAVHCIWKNRGVQCRPLFSLMLQLDAGRFLDASAREQVSMDYSIFTHALHPTSNEPCVVPDALPEILVLATDPSPDAPSMLANTLWYKYRGAADWAWKVWDNTVASLRQIPIMLEERTERRACALRYASFLIHVDQHIPTGLDEHVLSWFMGIGRSEVQDLSAETWNVVTVVLLHLSAYGALATTTIMQGLIYPVWQSAASTSTPEQGNSSEVLLGAINELCVHLLVKDTCDDEFPPSNAYEMQGLQTRRRDVFREPYFSRLVDNLPYVVLLEQNNNVPSQARGGFRHFRETLCCKSVFRLGVYRDLDAVHAAFEQVLTNSDIPEDLHEPLVNALRLMFHECQQGLELEETTVWQNLSTILSPWKLAATSIELRFTMRQLGEALGREVTRERANQYLEKLTSAVFGQGISSEEADFMAEIMKSVCPEITSKFVNAGMHNIAEVLSDPTLDMDALALKAGDILRLLTNVTQPMARDEPSLYRLEAWVQDRLAHALHDRFAAILHSLPQAWSQDGDIGARKALTEMTIILARLLQFDLGLTGAWTEEMKKICEPLSANMFQLTLLFGSGSSLDPVVFPVLVDTLCYLLDEVPNDPKAVTFDPFYCYPQIELQALPVDMPDEYRREMRTLLPYLPTNLAVADLAYISKDSTGAENVVPVQNRPWEWTEHLGEPVVADNDPSAVKNSASLSLELFAAHPTGERVISPEVSEDVTRAEGEVRALQDDTYGESIFRRDWRETRVDPESALSGPPKEQAQGSSGPSQTSQVLPSSDGRLSSSQSSRVASPTSVASVRSRGSVQPAGMGFTGSPVGGSRLTGSSAADPIDVDNFDLPAPTSTGRSKGKRKMADIAEDDEVEFIEGPLPTAHAEKKSKGKTASKSRAKKR